MDTARAVPGWSAFGVLAHAAMYESASRSCRGEISLEGGFGLVMGRRGSDGSSETSAVEV